MRTCTFPGCAKPHSARGLCSGHGQQRRSGREPTPLRIKRYPADAVCVTPGCARRPKQHGRCGICWGRERYREMMEGDEEPRLPHFVTSVEVFLSERRRAA